jgi:5-methyltetrahydrofolate--homocysteine methyltransferase
MDMRHFIAVGENIHCTRIVKSGGKRAVPLDGGGEGVGFQYQGADRVLPLPDNWAEISPAYNEGKIRHVQLAVWQALNGSGDDRQTGVDYLCWAAERQIEAGARYLDVNVDEYTNDSAERSEVMQWLATFLSERYDTPLSIDSSNVDVLAAGLSCCRSGVDPMVNSVSLEREDAVDVVIQYSAHAIVSAAAKEGLPSGIDDRMANFTGIIKILEGKKMPREKMHLDALVLPISVDPENGKKFLESSKQAAETFPGVNLNGGLSNISFGMPNRKLLNMVFCYLFVEHGGTGGIIDPVAMSPKAVGELDPRSESFKLARNVLVGEDMFGGEYIAAHREGRL